MIGERADFIDENVYGTLTMRPYNIQNNVIDAFYNVAGDLIFILDKTIRDNKPNVLLIINPDGDKKWDEILSGQYGVDLETIRPKVDNKYQKLDIEYSGLSVYDNLIRAYTSGEDLDEHMTQLDILRDSAARHSAMTRLTVANDIITKTNVTIVKTKETIVRLQERLKTLRAKLSAQKKEIGKVAPKQSAAKILRTESQIDATNEKLKRAKKRLTSAQRRLTMATVDAELASNLLNQPALEIKQTVKTVKPVAAAPVSRSVEPVEETEDVEFETESDIKPLFDEDPQIMDENIAFKPISFDTPVVNIENNIESKVEPVAEPEPVFEQEEQEEETVTEPMFTPIETTDSFETEEEPEFEAPVLNEEIEETESFEPVPLSPSLSNGFEEDVKNEDEFKDTYNTLTPRPVLETMKPIVEEEQHVVEPEPVVDLDEQPFVPQQHIEPVAPVTNNFAPVDVAEGRSKPSFIYYMLLFILIGLSVFTLWLYQKNMNTSTLVLTPATVETKVAEPVETQSADVVEVEPVVDVVETDFVEETVETPAPVVEPVFDEDEEVVEDEEEIDTEPVIYDSIPVKFGTSGQMEEDEETPKIMTEEELLANKPAYGAGSKHDKMFISADDYRQQKAQPQQQDVYDDDVFYDDLDADEYYFD